ncbi:MAG: iron hydrogenase small subunit, partial [Alkalispirochaetaceae bacterium]
IDKMKSALENGDEPPYHFVEVMACRGGCIGGGGQPYGATDEVRRKRIAGLYSDDVKSTVRCSHDNPQIQELYESFLGEPLGEKSHQYLHTHYTPRKLYQR